MKIQNSNKTQKKRERSRETSLTKNNTYKKKALSSITKKTLTNQKSSRNINHTTFPEAKVLSITECPIKFTCAYNSYKGKFRKTNEDSISLHLPLPLTTLQPNAINNTNNQTPPIAYFFAIFDGHGGTKCSEYLKLNFHNILTKNKNFPNFPIIALKQSFIEAEKNFIANNKPSNLLQNFDQSGSCAIVVLIISDKCYCANLGDSRAFYSEQYSKVVYQLNIEHKPNNSKEKERIIKAGGDVYQNSDFSSIVTNKQRPWRIIPGKLSVSRAFGDIAAKLDELGGNSSVLIAEPDIRVFKLSKISDFIIIGCDGVFDCLTNKEIVSVVWKGRKCEKKEESEEKTIAKKICDDIIITAMDKGSNDNLSCIFIGFRNFYRGLRKFGNDAKEEDDNPVNYIEGVNCDKVIETIEKGSNEIIKGKMENILMKNIGDGYKAEKEKVPNYKKTSFQNYEQQYNN